PAPAGGQRKRAETAQARLSRRDPARHPAGYVQVRCDAASSGELVVSLRNATSVPIGDIGIAVRLTGQRVLERRLTGVLGPGEVASVRTGLGPYTPGSGCPAQVTHARAAD